MLRLQTLLPPGGDSDRRDTHGAAAKGINFPARSALIDSRVGNVALRARLARRRRCTSQVSSNHLSSMICRIYPELE